MPKVPINARDLSAIVPDGPVNRHVHLTLVLDTDSGAVSAEYDLDAHRDYARNADGDLPKRQREAKED
jgi:hypothetical protein